MSKPKYRYCLTLCALTKPLHHCEIGEFYFSNKATTVAVFNEICGGLPQTRNELGLPYFLYITRVHIASGETDILDGMGFDEAEISKAFLLLIAAQRRLLMLTE